jgi:hypothetical protein
VKVNTLVDQRFKVEAKGSVEKERIEFVNERKAKFLKFVEFKAGIRILFTHRSHHTEERRWKICQNSPTETD